MVSSFDNATPSRALSSSTNSARLTRLQGFLTSAFGMTGAERASALLNFHGLRRCQVFSTYGKHMLSLFGITHTLFSFHNLPLTSTAAFPCAIPTSSVEDQVNIVCIYHCRFETSARKYCPICPKFPGFKRNRNQGNTSARQQYCISLPGLHDSQFFIVYGVSGCHQIPMHPQDIRKKNSLITPFGLHKFLRIPLGLKTVSKRFNES